MFGEANPLGEADSKAFSLREIRQLLFQDFEHLETLLQDSSASASALGLAAAELNALLGEDDHKAEMARQVADMRAQVIKDLKKQILDKRDSLLGKSNSRSSLARNDHRVGETLREADEVMKMIEEEEVVDNEIS